MTQLLLFVCLCFALPHTALAQTKGAARKPKKNTAKKPQTARTPAVQKAPTGRVAPTSRPAFAMPEAGQEPPLYNMDAPSAPQPPKGSALQRILKNQLLRVCVRADIPPFGYFQGGQLTGFDIQLAREISTQLSIDYKKNLRISWSVINAGSRIHSLVQNNCDMVVATFSITQGRARLIAFSKAYLLTHKVILRKVTIKRKTPVIALVRGTTTGGQKLKGSIRFFRNYTEIIDAMERSEVDFAVTDKPIAAHMLRSVPQPYKILRILKQKERYGIGMNLRSKALVRAVNRALRNLARTGRLAYLQRQWL